MERIIKEELQRSNPFKIRKCERSDCVLCVQMSWVDITCRTRGRVYEIKCIDCEKKYVGQTGRSLYDWLNKKNIVTGPYRPVIRQSNTKLKK